MARPFSIAILCLVFALLSSATSHLFAQRKLERAAAPTFNGGQLNGIFFPDAANQLKGQRPTAQAAPRAAASSATAGPSKTGAASDSDPLAWNNLISPSAIEDLIKGSKLRLDKAITTPAAFAGGTHAIARKEFSLQALLFAIIETYPTEVRWKNSAGVARELMTRVAANTKVASVQVYDEAKKRLLDLEDLTNGTALAGKSNSEIAWSKLIDHSPAMQLLEWSQQENISQFTANPAAFEKNKDALLHQAELVAVLGKIMTVEEMPNADDKDYVAFAKTMIEQAQQVSLAVKTNNADLARQAAGKIGQSCTNCHDSFR